MLRALRILGWFLTIILLICGFGVWWAVYRPLPQVDGTLSLPGLKSDVTVERDIWGVPHIRAGSLNDMVEAQGYVMAQDRLWQMDLLRRVARGQLSEIVGPDAIPIDKQFRTLRLGPAADREATLLDPEARGAMDAYARGVNAFIEQHQKNLPIEFTLLRYKPQPWMPTDSLVIAGYMYQTLSSTWEAELNRAKVTERVGEERAKQLYSDETAMDHFVVGDPNAIENSAQQSGRNPDDEDDDDDIMPDTVLKADRKTEQAPNFADLTSALAPALLEWVAESQRDIRQALGSNNWVVSGAYTATGKPLLANDTHLELSIPPIWYEAHLSAPGWNVKGFALPGGPLLVIGHNDRIAWGFTNNGADVQDLYIETFNPANSDEYRVKGQWKKAEIDDETIHVRGQADERLRLVVTRHGPIVRREGDKAYALRWTATEPGGLANTYYNLGKAQSWNEFRDVLKKVWGPAQNVVYADVDGNIGYIMAARVPVRKKGFGQVPVPGDTDDYEWTGYIPFGQLPQILNPASGLIVTANARVVGPKYKPYLTDRWEEPYRTARIYDLLHDKHDLRPADMLKVQADTYSYPDVFLGEQLASAAHNVTPKDERTKKLVAMTKDWNGIAAPDTSVVPFLELTRLEALRLILEPYLGTETDLYRWRKVAFLQKVLTERPAKWLPATYKSYDELIVAAADSAVRMLEERTKSTHIEDWQWKRFNALEMHHPIGRKGALKFFLSIADKAQAGTRFSPRAATKRHGPAMRFVANLANWDDSILLIPGGQSGQPGSSHYSDQFSYWFDGKPIVQPFSDAAEARTKSHTLTLKAGP
ncbi:MAG TPA: penicillin acylase family protein [Candidatus Sulfotelmatobacter sp.]|nr:penicillin acylase family protein [Candidatus Sulfotelmatobacter sp.]